MVLSARDIIKVYEFPWRDAMDLTAFSGAERISDYSGGLYERYGVSTCEPKREKQEAPQRHKEEKQPTLRITYPRDRRKDDGNDKSATPAAAKDASAGLEGKLREVYEVMTPGEKVSIDRLMRSGFTMGELMSALTQLEIRGLVTSVPGGLYLRK